MSPSKALVLLAASLAAATSTQAQTTITLSNQWTIAAGARTYCATSGNTERGVAVNPVNGHVYLVSRAGGLNVPILNGADGAELGLLSVNGVSGGTFTLSCIGVAEDGIIYGANLSGGAYKIYRWADETADPEIAYGPAGPNNTSARYGDVFDVRGAGTNTQILASGSGSGEVAIFTTTDGTNFTATPFLLSTVGLGAGDLGKGLCFGAENTIYGRRDGGGVVRVLSFDLAAATLTKIRDINVPSSLVAIDVDLTNKVLAALQSSTGASPHNLNLYDLSDPAASSLPLLGSVPFSAPNAGNGNLVGSVDLRGQVIAAVDPNNGVAVARMNFVSTAIPPGIAAQPAGANMLEGGYYTLSVSATGSKPFTYQWFLNEAPVSGQTAGSLRLTNVTAVQAGSYTVVVGNSAGSITSAPALVQVTATVRSAALTPLWTLPTGAPSWLTTDNTTRSLAYNPATGHVLVASRGGGETGIYVLDSASGQVLHKMNVDPSVVFGGTFSLNQVGVADDGAVYACNLTTDAAASDLIVYRWENDSADAVPAPIYLGNPSNGAGSSRRYGDTLDVRGAGLNTQLILTSRNANVAAILTTADGSTWTAIPVQAADAADGDFGLGVSFGEGNSFWAKSGGTALSHVGFDLSGYDPNGSTPVTGVMLHRFGTAAFPGNLGNIAVSLSSNLLAGVCLDTPDCVRLFDIADLSSAPVPIDTEFFPSDEPNGNGTGALDFGGGKLFALDTNNGIVAYAYQRVAISPGPLTLTRSGQTVTLSWDGTFKLQMTGSLGGSWTTIAGASSPYQVDIQSGPAAFYRLSN